MGANIETCILFTELLRDKQAHCMSKKGKYCRGCYKQRKREVGPFVLMPALSCSQVYVFRAVFSAIGKGAIPQIQLHKLDSPCIRQWQGTFLCPQDFLAWMPNTNAESNYTPRAVSCVSITWMYFFRENGQRNSAQSDLACQVCCLFPWLCLWASMF